LLVPFFGGEIHFELLLLRSKPAGKPCGLYEESLLRRLKIALLIALYILTAAPQFARPRTSADIRQETFNIVWTTVKEKHWDPTFGGVDWDKVRETYEPRVKQAKSDGEFYSLLQQMLGELHQSHFQIIPPGAIVNEDSREPQGGGIGIDIRLIDGQAVISRVDPGSPAENANLRIGFIVQRVDGTMVQGIVDRFKDNKESPSITRTRITRVIMAKINGRPGSEVKLEVLDASDKIVRATLVRERLKGEMSERFGNFPPQYTEFETKRLEGGIGYIRFNIFVMLLMQRLRDAIHGMHDAPGIIIDVRGNPGGIGGMASGIAGELESKQTSLGVMRMRVGYNNFAVFPQKNPYTGPVVILTDGLSASTSEIFAAGMQELGRATVVGERTMGAALPSVFFKLPTGAIFQYAIADFRTPKGTLVEGNGVKPDIEVKMTRKVLLEGRDPQLEAAIKQIKKQSKSVAGDK
jgi:carboxyl-terminal processing protease